MYFHSSGKNSSEETKNIFIRTIVNKIQKKIVLGNHFPFLLLFLYMEKNNEFFFFKKKKKFTNDLGDFLFDLS